MATTTDATATMDVAGRLRFAVVRLARRLRQEAGDELSPTMVASLATVERAGPLTPSELAQIERVKRPTATRVVARLVAEGLVERAVDPADGRVSLLTVTAEGSRLLKRLRKRKNAYLARRLRDLDPDEIRTLERAAEILEGFLESEPR
jgi:DNA-binding MarR family transcriptional regulator